MIFFATANFLVVFCFPITHSRLFPSSLSPLEVLVDDWYFPDWRCYKNEMNEESSRWAGYETCHWSYCSSSRLQVSSSAASSSHGSVVVVLAAGAPALSMTAGAASSLLP